MALAWSLGEELDNPEEMPIVTAQEANSTTDLSAKLNHFLLDLFSPLRIFHPLSLLVPSFLKV